MTISQSTRPPVHQAVTEVPEQRRQAKEMFIVEYPISPLNVPLPSEGDNGFPTTIDPASRKRAPEPEIQDIVQKKESRKDSEDNMLIHDTNAIVVYTQSAHKRTAEPEICDVIIRKRLKESPASTNNQNDEEKVKGAGGGEDKNDKGGSGFTPMFSPLE